jgi:hypothetical protein
MEIRINQETYQVGGLLVLVTLLVGGSLILVWLSLGVAQCLPQLTELTTKGT